MVFKVTAMKTAKDAHQDTLQLNEIPKCLPPEYNSTQISSVRHNQINRKFLFGDAESFRSRKLTPI